MSEADIIARFSDVISCTACDAFTSKKLLRDQCDNIPQPGYIGKNYHRTGLLLVGQNPGVAPEHMLERDRVYTQSLRSLGDEKSTAAYSRFYDTVVDFVPDWPVNRSYFPLEACGFDIEDIAYCNVVRCRTVDNAAPSKGLINNCIEKHFIDLVKTIDPKVVIFIGKWAHDQAAHLLPEQVRYAYMNRMRSLSSLERQNNRSDVVALVNSCVNYH
jgi:uracil-DNA glycosylase